MLPRVQLNAPPLNLCYQGQGLWSASTSADLKFLNLCLIYFLYYNDQINAMLELGKKGGLVTLKV